MPATIEAASDGANFPSLAERMACETDPTTEVEADLGREGAQAPLPRRLLQIFGEAQAGCARHVGEGPHPARRHRSPRRITKRAFDDGRAGDGYSFQGIRPPTRHRLQRLGQFSREILRQRCPKLVETLEVRVESPFRQTCGARDLLYRDGFEGPRGKQRARRLDELLAASRPPVTPDLRPPRQVHLRHRFHPRDQIFVLTH